MTFALNAKWNFFATSHGKNAYDGVGGTVKRLTAHEAYNEQKKTNSYTETVV